MKALVVYDSAGGNTDKVAEAICSGMKQMGYMDTVCKAAGTVTAADLQGTDVWVMGSPNGFLAGRKVGKVLKNAPAGAKAKGFVFDTRTASATMGSADKIAAAMRAKGIEVVGKTYFSLGPGNTLLEGEEGLAVAYGRNLVNNVK